MGLINPLFLLAGALLVAVPILIHILNRRRHKTVRWAAMDFLLRAMKRNRRRLRFESWLLLAARCTVLLLLGLALARPFGCGGGAVSAIAGRSAGLHVLVVDNSGSMSYQADRPEAATHLEQAKRTAAGLLAGLTGGGERVAVVTAAAPAGLPFDSPTYDVDAATAAVEEIDATAAGTDLAGALEAALALAEDSAGEPTRVLHVLTDAATPAFADAERLGALGPRLAEAFTDVFVHDLSQDGQWNRGVVALGSDAALARTGFADVLEGVVRGYGTAPAGQAQARAAFALDGRPIEGAGGTLVPDAQTPPLPVVPRFDGGGRHVVGLALEPGDRLPLDDVRRTVIDVAANLPVLIVEGERGLGPLTGSGEFLDVALAPPADDPARPTLSYVRTERVSDLELGNKVLGEYRAVFLAGVGSVAPETAEALAAFVRGGGALFVLMGDAVSADNYNGQLLPRGLLPGPLTQLVRSESAGGGATFAFDPAAAHPYLAAFRSNPDTGLTSVTADLYWKIEPQEDRAAEVVLPYAGGDPAILLHRLGEGRVVTVTTAADPQMQWSNLSSRPVFVSLVHELLSHAAGGGDGWLNVAVGEPTIVPASAATGGVPTMTDPQGRAVRLERVEGGAYQSQPLAEPGVYRVTAGPAAYPVAVNPPASESDVRPLAEAAIVEALGDIDVTFVAGDREAAQATEMTAGRDDFGWVLLLAVLALAAAEALMATHFGRGRA